MKKVGMMVLGLAAVFCLALVVQAADEPPKKADDKKADVKKADDKKADDKKADDKKADAPKEVTLKGTITCAMCGLKLEDAKECATVILVKGEKAGDFVIYYLDEKSHKANHPAICKAAKTGSVVGVVSEKDGKKIITASKVTLNEEKPKEEKPKVDKPKDDKPKDDKPKDDKPKDDKPK